VVCMHVVFTSTLYALHDLVAAPNMTCGGSDPFGADMGPSRLGVQKAMGMD
jgi:hypothetical protein